LHKIISLNCVQGRHYTLRSRSSNKISTPKCNSYPSLTARKTTVNAMALIHNGQGALGMGIGNIGVAE
jgi:hypothetical protein